MFLKLRRIATVLLALAARRTMLLSLEMKATFLIGVVCWDHAEENTDESWFPRLLSWQSLKTEAQLIDVIFTM